MLVNCLVYKDHKIVHIQKIYHIRKIIYNQPINRLQSVIKMYYIAHS